MNTDRQSPGEGETVLMDTADNRRLGARRRWRDWRIHRALRKPLKINGVKPAHLIKCAYDLGVDLSGPGRYDQRDPVQQQLRRIKDWITMAEHDALDSRKESS